MIELDRIANYLSLRREQLGMSDYHVAHLSGVSQPTVYRFLSGQSDRISAVNMLKIARAMGVEIGPDLQETSSVKEFREKRAAVKAARIIRGTQSTSALEAQGVKIHVLEDIEEQIKQQLLAGPQKDLWAE